MFNDLLKTIFNKIVNESNSNTKNETVNESNSNTKNETVNESNSNTKNETVNESNSSTKNETVNESNSSTKNETVNESNGSTKNETVNESNSSTKNETVNESNSNIKNESKSDYESDHESDYENDNEGDNLDEIEQLNNWFKRINQTKSLEEQIELLKSKNFLYEYWSLKYYNINKDLSYKIFKAKTASLLINFNKEILKKVYGCNFIALAEKLVNTVDKKENQTIVNDIKNNKNKIHREYKDVIKHENDEDVIKHRSDLLDATKFILEINEVPRYSQ